MNTGETRPIKISFPFGLYLKQLFSADSYVRFINPFSFWRRYRINYLETCCELDLVQYLEDCYQLQWQPVSSFKPRKNRGATNTSSYAFLETADLNSMIIFQPTVQLKYRGVTYQTRNIASIKIDCQKINPSELKPDSIEQPLNSDNVNSPGISGNN